MQVFQSPFEEQIIISLKQVLLISFYSNFILSASRNR